MTRLAIVRASVAAATAALGATGAGMLAPRLQAATSCTDLARVALPHTTIEHATLVAAGTFRRPPAAPAPDDETAENRARAEQTRKNDEKLDASVPAFCRVLATLKPTADSDIKVEVWLPASGWNGKFQGTGNGGWAGTMAWSTMANAVKAGYAAATTDTGHVGNNAQFAPGHPEKLIDFGYRAIHEMTLTGKAVTSAFYGSDPKLSFFNGCSLGGRQAITEAMRYPADYNGIVAGAPVIYTMQVHAARAAINHIANRTPDAVIPPAKYAAIHDAVLNACDARDGVKDGVLEDPMQCRFDPGVLLCRGADSNSCLTAPQVETVRQLYAPMSTGAAGTIPALLQPGTEMSWSNLAGPKTVGTAIEPMRYIVFNDPSWTSARFNPATDFDRAMAADKDQVLGLTDPNLSPFFNRGGKLLMYHGWQDPQVPAQSSPRYFNEVLKTVGEKARGTSIQLYMVPGMNHCSGGPGTDTFDKMAAIESFVATGKAPAQILASHKTHDVIDRTRPLCPYGQVAKWNGTGSTDDAANFSCVANPSTMPSR